MKPQNGLCICLVLAWGLLANVVVMSSVAHAGPSRTHAPFPSVKFAYAKAYLFNVGVILDGQRPDEHIYQAGRWSTTKVGRGIRLDTSTVDRINSILSSDIRPLLMGLSNCFIPRHGLVYFDRRDRPVASVSICFECESMRTWPSLRVIPMVNGLTGRDITTAERRLTRLRTLLEASKVPVYDTADAYQVHSTEQPKPACRGVNQIKGFDWSAGLGGHRLDFDTLVTGNRRASDVHLFGEEAPISIHIGNSWVAVKLEAGKTLVGVSVESSAFVMPNDLRIGASWRTIDRMFKGALALSHCPQSLRLIDDHERELRLQFREGTVQQLSLITVP